MATGPLAHRAEAAGNQAASEMTSRDSNLPSASPVAIADGAIAKQIRHHTSIAGGIKRRDRGPRKTDYQLEVAARLAEAGMRRSG